MADKKINCALCGAENPDPMVGGRCQSCGAQPSMAPGSRGGDAANYHHGFSSRWCGISVAIVGIFTASVIWGLPMVVSALDFEGSAGMMLSIPIWFTAGVLVGLVSPNRTVAEPVVATFLVAMPTAFLLFQGQTVKTLPAFMYVLLSALGVLFALIGSYTGERIQMGPARASS